jgi:RNA polymerase sigma-70 factor (ECF subfamily)
MQATVAVPIPAAEQTDLDLVQGHRYGDPQAFEEVYRRFSHMVYNLALRLSGDPDEATDLTQEVFLRAFRHLGKFRGGSSLKTWLYRVAVNHCRSRLGRGHRRWLLPLPESVAETAPEPSPGPEEQALAEDEGRRVERALAAIPAHFREAVVLRDLEGLAYEEIAQVLRVRVGTVRSRIARGRERLRELLLEGQR